MEAIILAGGKAERLGEAAEGKPKALVAVAGRPLMAYQLALLARAGVRRVIVSCAAGQEELFSTAFAGSPLEILPIGEPEPLGRGGGLRYAATARQEDGDVFALNGDELVDTDLAELLRRHRELAVAATVTVTRMRSAFGVVDVGAGDLVSGFREAPELPFWVSCGVYVLGEEALARLPERGDHEQSTFPELTEAGRLGAFRHQGIWLTVNTPKDLRTANEYVREHSGTFSLEP